MTCAGTTHNTCRGIVVACPGAPHRCSLRCAGSADGTCREMDVRGAATGSLSVECATTHDACGFMGTLACPAGGGSCVAKCTAAGAAARRITDTVGCRCRVGGGLHRDRVGWL